MGKGTQSKRGPGRPRKCYKSSGHHAAKKVQLNSSLFHLAPSPPSPDMQPLLSPSSSSVLELTPDELMFTHLATQCPGIQRFLGKGAPSKETRHLFLATITLKKPQWVYCGSVNTAKLHYWFDMQVSIHVT
jgi:hypothetical protein